MDQYNAHKLPAFEAIMMMIITNLDKKGFKYNNIQTHLIWVSTGLLVAQPKDNDFIYVNSDIEKKRSKRDGNGIYHASMLFSVEEMIAVVESSYGKLVNSLYLFEEKGLKYKSYEEFSHSMNERTLKRLTREIKFLIAGYLVCGIEMSMEVYQYAFINITADNLMFRATYSTEYNEWLHNAQKSQRVCGYETISVSNTGSSATKAMSVVKSFSVLGRFMLNARCSVMLPRYSNQNTHENMIGISDRLRDEANNVRRIIFNKNTTILESQRAEIEIGLGDSDDAVNRQIGAAAKLLKETSMVNGFSGADSSKVYKQNKYAGNVDANRVDASGHLVDKSDVSRDDSDSEWS